MRIKLFLPRYLLLLAGAVVFVFLQAALYRAVCPRMLLAANSNPVLHGGVVLRGLYTHLLLVLTLIIIPPLLMVPYRVLYFHGLGGFRRYSSRLLGLEAWILYVPSLVAAGIVAAIYHYYSTDLAGRFVYMVSAMSLIFTAIAVYASVFAIPWATAKALLNRSPSVRRVLLLGAGAILAAKITALVSAEFLRHTYNPVFWRCSAKALGVDVVNSKTWMLEKLYTVDASLVAAVFIVTLLYYYILTRYLKT